MILFLDFDGVLHPRDGHNHPLFGRTSLLWQILHACPTAEVVFSTSWRENFTVPEMMNFVTYGGGEELAHRFIGSTPVIDCGENDYRREDECKSWLVANSLENHPWLAIDDNASWFDAANLHYVDYRFGLVESDVAAIIDAIKQQTQACRLMRSRNNVERLVGSLEQLATGDAERHTKRID